MVSCHTRRGASYTDTRAPAVANRMFLDNTRSQLTYTGLFAPHSDSGCVCCAKRLDIELEYLRVGEGDGEGVSCEAARAREGM